MSRHNSYAARFLGVKNALPVLMHGRSCHFRFATQPSYDFDNGAASN